MNLFVDDFPSPAARSIGESDFTWKHILDLFIKHDREQIRQTEIVHSMIALVDRLNYFHIDYLCISCKYCGPIYLPTIYYKASRINLLIQTILAIKTINSIIYNITVYNIIIDPVITTTEFCVSSDQLLHISDPRFCFLHSFWVLL